MTPSLPVSSGSQVRTYEVQRVRMLRSYQVPTIAAINGHAFAAGFILALACDYRVMTSGRAWCSMNEVRFAELNMWISIHFDAIGWNNLRSCLERHSHNQWWLY